MDWDKLRIFHAAAEAGSFTHAGETLHMSQSAVSRQVSALERDLKVPLFHRHARGLVLTEPGEMLFRTVADVLAKLQTAETMLSDAGTKPMGELRLTAPVGLGTVWLTQRLREFMELYPEITIELTLTDEKIDIAMRAADVALWIGEPEQSDLIRRRLFTMSVHAYASGTYLRKFGMPADLSVLDQHRVISYSGAPAQHLTSITWLDTAGLEGRATRRAILRVNSVVAMKFAVRAGIGIGMLPDYLVEGEQDIVPVLVDHEAPKLSVFYAYPEELKGSKKVQVLRDFLVAKSRQWKH